MKRHRQNLAPLLQLARLSIIFSIVLPLRLHASGQDSTAQADEKNEISPPKVTGYAQINYLQFLKEPSKDKASGFNINRVRFAFEGEIIPGRVEYAVEFDPQGSPILDDTYLDYIFNDKARMRVGRYKIPFGAENPTGEDELNFIEKSKIVENVFSPREVGVGTLFDMLRFSGDVGYFQKAEEQRIERDVIGHLGVMPFGKVMDIGVSGYYEHVSTDTTKFALNRYGVDGTFLLGPIEAQGEIIWSKGTLEDKSVDAFGYFAYILYTHTVHKIPVTWGVRYEYFDPNRHDNHDHELKYVGGTTIQFHPRMRMQINYQRITQALPGKDDTQNKIIAQYQFSF